MIDTKKLKQEVDILQVLEYIGARFGGGAVWEDELGVFCPFCEDRDSRRAAGRANIIKQLYHCFNCDVGGDVITLVKVYQSCDFDTAVQWLIDTFGVGDVSR